MVDISHIRITIHQNIQCPSGTGWDLIQTSDNGAQNLRKRNKSKPLVYIPAFQMVVTLCVPVTNREHQTADLNREGLDRSTCSLQKQPIRSRGPAVFAQGPWAWSYQGDFDMMRKLETTNTWAPHTRLIALFRPWTTGVTINCHYLFHDFPCIRIGNTSNKWNVLLYDEQIHNKTVTT